MCDAGDLVSTWDEYRRLLDLGVCYGLDLSHLNIVARRERRRDPGLVRALLTSPQCIEVHVSDSDGRRDVHWMLTEPPWWWTVLRTAHRVGMTAVVFSEGNQLRDPGRRSPLH
jgi:hypothetical protein